MASDNIADPMDDNTALREILGEVRLIDAVIRGQYDAISAAEDIAVTSDEPYERAANAEAVKTVITNTHATNAVKVYEGGALVKILPAGETWVSPLNGGGEISVTAEAGSDAEIAVATYTRED